MRMVKFIGVPRSVVDREVGEMYGWRHLGERMLAAARDACPVSDEGDRGANAGPHLKDLLQLRVITGSDPRLLIGTTEKADVLGYLTLGTVSHFVAPVNAKVLHWTKGGTDYFSAGHEVSGIEPNDFVLRAARAVAQETV